MFRLIFLFSAIPIEFIKCLTGARVNENDTVNFICELNKPNIHVKWFLNEEPITNGMEKFSLSFYILNITKFHF